LVHFVKTRREPNQFPGPERAVAHGMVRVNRLQLAALQTAQTASSRTRRPAESFNAALNKAADSKTASTAQTAKGAAALVTRPNTPVSSGRTVPASRETTQGTGVAQTAGALATNLPPTTNAPSTPHVPDQVPASQQAPTLQSVFGDNPYMANPTMALPDGSVAAYNPMWFATPATAQKVAQILGGTVVEANDFTGEGGVIQQQQVNEMVQLPNGRLVNAGLVASYYDHGFSTSQLSEYMNAIKSEKG
jgi:hypothetical protein